MYLQGFQSGQRKEGTPLVCRPASLNSMEYPVVLVSSLSFAGDVVRLPPQPTTSSPSEHEGHPPKKRRRLNSKYYLPEFHFSSPNASDKNILPSIPPEDGVGYTGYKCHTLKTTGYENFFSVVLILYRFQDLYLIYRFVKCPCKHNSKQLKWHNYIKQDPCFILTHSVSDTFKVSCDV